MSDTSLTADAREKLKRVSVATLTTCLFKRGFKSQTIQNVRPIDPTGPRLVGKAFTLRTIPAREDLAVPAILADRAYPARAAIEACPAGHVLVIDSRKDPRSASGGDILMTRLMVRGVAGCVTDGGMLSGVRFGPEVIETETIVYRSITGTVRRIYGEHRELSKFKLD